MQKEALQTAVIHGGLNCEVVPEDDPKFKICYENKVPHPQIDFSKVTNINEWFYWLKNTVKPNVRYLGKFQ